LPQLRTATQGTPNVFTVCRANVSHLSDRLLRCGKIDRVGVLQEDDLVYVDGWSVGCTGVAGWRVTLPGGIQGWVRGKDEVGAALIDLEAPRFRTRIKVKKGSPYKIPPRLRDQALAPLMPDWKIH
jgi:hypothetical protein